MKYAVEYTDLFGGQANYAWCYRETFEAPADASQALLMRRAKKLMGLEGVRGQTCSAGELLEFRPYRMCTVLFVYADFS